MKLSASSISTYLDCARLFKFKHLERLSSEETIYMIYGTVMHDFYDKLMLGVLGVEEASEQFRTAFSIALSKSKVTAPVNRGNVLIQKMKQGEESLLKFNKLLLPPALETEVSFEIPWCEDVTLTGRVDVVAENNTNIDFKSSGTLPSMAALNIVTQVDFYAFTYYLSHDAIVPNMLWYYTEKDIVMSIPTRTQQQLDETTWKIDTVAEGVRLEKFIRRGDPYRCKDCEFLEICSQG